MFDGQVLAISQLLAKNGPRAAVERVKCLIPLDQVRKYFTILLNDSRFAGCKRTLLAGLFPNEKKLLRKSGMKISFRNIERELFWEALMFEVHADALNKFILAERDYQRYLLVGDFLRAEAILDEVERNWGFSLWLWESRLVVLELGKGLEAHKNFMQSITNDESIDGVAKVIIANSSARIEKNVSFGRFSSVVDSLMTDLDKVNSPESVKEYVRAKLHFWRQTNLTDHVGILNIESRSPIFDRYLTFIKICQVIASDDQYVTEKKAIIKALQLLLGKVSDQRLHSLALYLGMTLEDVNATESDEFILACDQYTAGNYDDSIARCIKIIQRQPEAFEAYNLLARAAVYAGRRSIDLHELSQKTSEIIASMLSILLKNDLSLDSYNLFLKHLLVFSSQSWASGLCSFLIDEFRNWSVEDTRRYRRIALLNAIHPNPRALVEFRDYHANWLPRSTEVKSSSISLFLALGVSEPAGDSKIFALSVPEERRSRYIAKRYAQRGDYPEVIGIYKALLKKNEFLGHQDAVIGLANCYIATHEKDACADLLVDACFSRPNIVFVLPISALLSQLSKLSVSLSPNISIPILFDIYTKKISSDKLEGRSDAFVDFLAAVGCDRPTQLRTSGEEFDSPKLIYFLEHLCVHEVLDSSISIGSSDEVFEERIAVLQWLSDLNSSSADRYSEEIKKITEELLIRRGIKEIEESKIYVDVEGIKKTVDVNLRDTYDRYISLLKLPSATSGADYITVKLEEGFSFQLPSNEANNLFANMYVELRDRFVSSNEYGLDAYLSVRIRHGTLSGQVRSALEAAHLVTEKDGKGNYKENIYWKEKLNGANSVSLAKIMRALAAFSASVDELISGLIRNQIQVTTETRGSKGLFNFSVYVEEFEKFRSRVTPETSYSEYLDIVFSELWRITESSLSTIRDEIGQTLKPAFNRAFETLREVLSIWSHEPGVGELSMKVTSARTAIQYDLDKISNWFRLPRSDEDKDYDFGLAVRIAVEMVKNIYPHKNLTANLTVPDGIQLPHRTLRPIVDTLFTLVENAARHGASVMGEARLSVHVASSDGELSITVQNRLTQEANLKELSKRLNAICQSVKRVGAIDRVRQEGGSGFYKIAKIMSIDLGCPVNIATSVEENNGCTVSIKLSEKVLRYGC